MRSLAMDAQTGQPDLEHPHGSPQQSHTRFGIFLQPKSEGRDDLAGEIERLRAENARIKQQLSGAADTPRQSAGAGADAGRPNSRGAALSCCFSVA